MSIIHTDDIQPTNEVSVLLDKLNGHLKDIPKQQELSVLKQISQEYFKISFKEKSDFENIRHTTLHLGKLLGKIASYCEKMEEGLEANKEIQQVRNEVIPDLLFWGLFLAELEQIDLFESFYTRIHKHLKDRSKIPKASQIYMSNNILKSAWIHIVNKKVLMARNYGKTAYFFPGGKIESTESPQEALVRELKEELGIKASLDSIKFYRELAAQAFGKPEGVMVVEKCFFADFDGDIEPNSEVEELFWADSKLIGTDRSTAVGNLVLQSLKDDDLIN